MRILVVDPRLGYTSSEVFVLEADGTLLETRSLGYVPEIRYQPWSREFVVIESDVKPATPVHSLAVWDGATLGETLRVNIPPRPTYSGFAGRSIGGSISPSGRFLYFLRSGPIQQIDQYTLAFRVIPCRYDRHSGAFEESAFFVDSCHIDYGVTGHSEDELYFHLSCEHPSTLAFGGFADREPQYLRMLDLPGRVHGPRETNGSWLDRANNRLFCVNRAGDLFQVDLVERSIKRLRELADGEEAAVPIHNVYSSADWIYVGRSRSTGEQGNGLASRIDRYFSATGTFSTSIPLPMPAMNFAVWEEGDLLVATSPFQRCVFAIDLSTGSERWRRTIGRTPGEVILAP